MLKCEKIWYFYPHFDTKRILISASTLRTCGQVIYFPPKGLDADGIFMEGILILKTLKPSLFLFNLLIEIAKDIFAPPL